jgi:YD repeat-containing protein
MRRSFPSSVFFMLLSAMPFLAFSVFAQNSPGLKSFTPPGPTASALGKFGETPISLYTGVPSISVPLYSVKSGDLELPISLDYHAGGIKVEEVASWVGLGFSLNAGGTITRSIRGLPDDAQNGYFNTRASTSALGEKYIDNPTPTTSYGSFEGNGESEDISSFEQILGQIKDGEPDVFYFNFGKYQGKFFMNAEGQFVAIPVQAIKIEYQTNSAGVMRWQITTPDGVKYIFGTTLDSDPVRTAIEMNQNTSGNNLTSWYLLEILSPYNNRIDLSYTMESFNYQTKSSEVINLFLESNPSTYMDVSIPPYDKKVGQNYFQAPRLDNITFPNGMIKFIATTPREDITNSNALARIEIQGPAAKLLKAYNFTYDYFESAGGCPTDPQYCKRLKLEMVEEQSAGNTKGGKYAFSYSNTQLPSWDAFGTQINSQDLWGFCNGVSNTVLPGSMSFQTSGGSTISFSGADRHSDEGFMKACVLTQITYPTGGYTIFDYEANRLNASDHDLGNSQTAAVGRGDFIEYETGESTEKTITIADPDPNTGHVVMTFNNRQQVREMDYTVTPSRQKCAPDPNSGMPTCFEAYIEGTNGTTYARHYLIEGISTVSLLPGEYKISGRSLAGYEDFENVTQPKIYYLQLNWTEYPQSTSIYAPTDKVVGGLRIARITNHSEDGNTVKRYLYSKFNEDISSAVIVNYPYRYANIFLTVHDVNNVASTATFGQIKSTSLVPLISSQGSVLGYANVTELDGENGENGKTQYTFSTATDYPDEIKLYRPYPPSCSFDFRRGLLRKKAVFVGNSDDTLHVTRNYYTFDKNAQFSYGISVEKEVNGDMVSDATNYYVSGFKTYSEFFFQNREVERTYSPPGSSNFLEAVTEFEYGWPQGHYQLTRSSTLDSKGQNKETINKYPADLELTGDAETARQALLANFMVNPVLEQTTFKDGEQLEKIVTDYKVMPEGTVNPSSIHRSVGDSPLENLVTFSKYDGFGNVLQQARENDFNNSYLWDYHHEHVVAEVKNADFDDIGYTSFEADGAGNLEIASAFRVASDARSGKNCYNLSNGSISKPGCKIDMKYTINFWAKSGSISLNGSVISATNQPAIEGWQFYETTFVGSPSISTVTITGTALIDDLRIYPSDAEMITYTYDRLAGLTSMTDANQKTTYYEYDDLGRLQYARDDDRNVVKAYSYHYRE